jgi:uncharacterized protein with von Willebrand factor type A (vWA) domain
MVIDDLEPYRTARRRLNDFTVTGTDAVDDTFLALTKANPQLKVRDDMLGSHFLNHAVAREMLDLSAVRRLRLSTVGDPLQAALACVDIEPKLETIFDRLHLAQAMAERLDALFVALQAALEEVAAAEAEFDGAELDSLDGARLQAARDALGDLQGQVDALEAELAGEIAGQGPRLRIELQEAMSDAAVQAALFDQCARAWGTERGMLRRLSAEDRLAMAQRLQSSRLQEIAMLFGRLQAVSFSDAVEQSCDVHEEIVDLELGDNLGRVLPAELLLLGDPVTEIEFLARWSDRELVQYAVEGSDELGRGGIIFCCDGSYSMHGPREIFAKAVMLVLMHEARRSNRRMHVLHFGSYEEVQLLSFESRSDFTPERIMEAAELFHGGGTDYETPMRHAVKLLEAEFAATGRTKADVVFASDDECDVSAEVMEGYLEDMKRLGSRTWGLCFGWPDPDGAMAAMAPGRLMTVEDLAGGQDVRELLVGIR